MCISVFAQWCMLKGCAHCLECFFAHCSIGSTHQSVADAKSVASLGFGLLVLILVQMIDSPGPSGLSLAVNMFRVTLSHQERSERRKKELSGRKRESSIKWKRGKECRASCQNALYQFWQTETSALSVNM